MLLDIIEAATPAPWEFIDTDRGVQEVRAAETRATIADNEGYYPTAVLERDLRFIATFDPEHVALLLAVVQEDIGGGRFTPQIQAVRDYWREHGLDR